MERNRETEEEVMKEEKEEEKRNMEERETNVFGEGRNAHLDGVVETISLGDV